MLKQIVAFIGKGLTHFTRCLANHISLVAHPLVEKHMRYHDRRFNQQILTIEQERAKLAALEERIRKFDDVRGYIDKNSANIIKIYKRQCDLQKQFSVITADMLSATQECRKTHAVADEKLVSFARHMEWTRSEFLDMRHDVNAQNIRLASLRANLETCINKMRLVEECLQKIMA